MGTVGALRVDDFLALPDPAEGYYELSEGELITVPSGNPRHEYAKSMIVSSLVVWRLKDQRGLVLSESMLVLGDETVRAPDVAFVVDRNRFLADIDGTAIRVIPEIAVEVISDSEPAGNADKKLHQYLRAGILEVWQVFPGSHSVLVHTSHDTRRLEGDQALETPILPGFSVKISAFFP